ncbi:unnamed protein product, partial [Rotaria magnacalcarata]
AHHINAHLSKLIRSYRTPLRLKIKQSTLLTVALQLLRPSVVAASTFTFISE